MASSASVAADFLLGGSPVVLASGGAGRLRAPPLAVAFGSKDPLDRRSCCSADLRARLVLLGQFFLRSALHCATSSGEVPMRTRNFCMRLPTSTSISRYPVPENWPCATSKCAFTTFCDAAKEQPGCGQGVWLRRWASLALAELNSLSQASQYSGSAGVLAPTTGGCSWPGLGPEATGLARFRPAGGRGGGPGGNGGGPRGGGGGGGGRL
mmetsp:Transcript_22676/g.66023  ORF Transcript_22676/g.66023 Transcript_22676/m.66023 type:complete len:210 (-) Transcript_22676:1-630(-)